MPCVESGGGVHVCMYVFFRSIQQEIFSECVLDIVESVLDGYNDSIIAKWTDR